MPLGWPWNASVGTWGQRPERGRREDLKSLLRLLVTLKMSLSSMRSVCKDLEETPRNNHIKHIYKHRDKGQEAGSRYVKETKLK